MIKTGEYIRTKSGYIGNVVNINEFRPPEAEICVDMNFSDYVFVGEEDIKTHSKNIIDLIEMGDYVNGTKVTNIDNYDNIYTIEWEYGNVYTTEIINDKFIKTILTHELYEQNCYKVVE